MKNSTKIVLVALAAIVLVATAAVLAPGTSHANADPSPIAIPYNAARIPWTSSCAIINDGGNEATCSTPTVPAGHPVVIQSVTFDVPMALIDTPPSSSPLLWQPIVTVTTGGAAALWESWVTDQSLAQPLASPAGTNYYQLSFSAPLTLYADPGTAVKCSLNIPNASDTFFDTSTVGATIGTCNLTGYAVNLGGGPTMAPL